MARIAGVDLPRDKRVEVGLTYIFGIGPTTARNILKRVGIVGEKRVRDLDESEVGRINNLIQNHLKVEGDLRREVSQNIKRLMDIGCYRGLRHRKALPARGQRTRTNARTRKGPRKTVGVRKKETK
jgi:small subunit ribosomal protein S13